MIVSLVLQSVVVLSSLLLSALVAIAQMLPAFGRGVRQLAVFLMRVSFVLYQAILTRLQPFAATVRIDLLSSAWRVAATTVLSLVIGVVGITVAGWSVTFFVVCVAASHGVLVGILWDVFGPLDGLTLGD